MLIKFKIDGIRSLGRIFLLVGFFLHFVLYRVENIVPKPKRTVSFALLIAPFELDLRLDKNSGNFFLP